MTVPRADGVGDLNRNRVVLRNRPHPFQRPRLRAFAHGPAVVGALADDDHGLPRHQPDVERQQPRLLRLGRVDVPDQPVRVAQPVGPDLLARALEGRERIVVGDPVAAVLADRAGRRVLAQVGHDAPDLSDERVEPLRVDAAAVLLVARAGIAGADVHDPPVGIAAPRDRVEGHLAQRVLRQRMLQPQQLARRALERRVGRIAIRPFDQHDLPLDLPVNGRRRNRRRGGVARQVQTGHDAGLRRRRTRPVRVLHVHRVEDAVARVVGIEEEVGEARREVALERELREQARPAAEPVEIQVDGRLLRLLVEDVERAVEVVDEEAPAARLVAKEVDPGQLPSRVLAVQLAGDRQLRVVLHLESQPWRGLSRERIGGRDDDRGHHDTHPCHRWSHSSSFTGG